MIVAIIASYTVNGDGVLPWTPQIFSFFNNEFFNIVINANCYHIHVVLRKRNICVKSVVLFTHFGLVTSYGEKDPGQHWLR